MPTKKPNGGVCTPRFLQGSMIHTNMPMPHNRSDVTEPMELVTALLPASQCSNERVMFVTRGTKAHEVVDDEEDQDGTPGRLRVQAETEVDVAELPRDGLVENGEAFRKL